MTKSMPSLSFSSISAFLRSGEYDKIRNEPTFTTIDKFLKENKDLILNISGCVQSDDNGKGSSFGLKTSEDHINPIDHKVAEKLSKKLSINLSECLRVISITRLQYSGCDLDEETIAKQILHERNCILDTTLLLLNQDTFPILEDSLLKAVLQKKSDIVDKCIKLLRQLLTTLSSSERNAEYSSVLVAYDFVYIGNLLNLIALLTLNQPTDIKIITQWYKLLADTKYFQSILDNKETPSEIFHKLEALMIMVTLLITGLDSANCCVNIASPFFNDPTAFKEILETIMNSPPPAVIVYHWSFILFSKSYMLEENPEENLTFVQEVFGSKSISALVSEFASSAEDDNVFSSISDLSETFKHQTFYTSILSSFITFSLYFFPINTVTSQMIKDVMKNTPTKYVEKFLTNKEFEKKFFVLKTKAPLLNESLIPMLNITCVHPEFAHFEWKELLSYTQKVVLGSLEYDLADDSSSSDLIMIKKDTLVEVPLEKNKNVLLPIPKNSKAKILPSSSDADVLMFFYKYNGWSLIGRVLQNASEQYLLTSSTSSQNDQLKEIIIPIFDLISSVIGNGISLEKSTKILEYLSTYVTDEDVFAVIFKIFEQSLHVRDFDVIEHGVKLLINMTENYSHWVWSHLARSELLDRYGKSGLISSILGTMELPNGNYSITIQIINLAQQLALESLKLESEFPDRLKKEILSKFIQHFIHVYESFQYWSYVVIAQKYELGTQLTSLFMTVIYNVYGIDPVSKPENKITRVLSSAAEAVINKFLSCDSPDVRTVTSLLHVILSSNSTEALSVGNEIFSSKYSEWLTQSFELSNLLISVRALLKLSPSTLEHQIYQNLPKFVDVYISHQELRSPIIKLFTHLVRAPWSDNFPSFLSYLGQEHASLIFKSFLSDLQSEIDDYQFLKNFYNFFSSVMEGKQDGFSILLVTGVLISVGNGLEDNKTGQKAQQTSVLTLLKRNVLKLDSYPESVASQLLEAISYAFNSWAAARNNTTDNEFIDFLVRRLETFDIKCKQDSIQENNRLSNQYRLQARIAEIFALHLFTVSGSNSKIITLLNSKQLEGIVKSIFSIDGYNETLQANLHRDFKVLWPGLNLNSFTVSPLYRAGKPYQTGLYNIDLLDQFFSSDEKWWGTESSPGFRQQVIKSSVNLQFVSFQITAARSWGALLTAFIKKTPTPLKPFFADIVENFLSTSTDLIVDAPMFCDVHLLKIELVFYILYSFLQTSTTIPESQLLTILSKLLLVLKSKELNYLGNISQSLKNNHYRPVLRSVLIILTLAKSYPMFIEKGSDILLEIFELSFSKGVNLILSDVLSSFSVATSQGKKFAVTNMADKMQDLLLLLSILSRIKDLNPLPSFNNVLASSLNEFGTLKSLLNLYYSCYIFKSSDEPLFAELTLSFISEMVTIDSVAKKMIDNGLFSVFLESPISITIQKGGIRSEIFPRLHSIWSNGLLSIVLQLLSKFGSSILSEVCLFASYFSKQIDSSVNGWSSDSLSITQAYTQETSQIILLQKMLDKLDYQRHLSFNGSRIKVIDEKEIIEVVPGLDTKVERNELSNILKHLLTHPKYLNSRIVAPSLEKQKFMEDEGYRNQLLTIIVKQISDLQSSLMDDI